jgi:4-carboxymuconolactone decarboxylase
MSVRRAVLGDEYVDASIAATNDFVAPLQQLITEYGWGEVWTRPELDRRTRSLVNLGMLTALNRPAELRLHVRGALNNGCTLAEIREVLLQTAVYCGIPAAIEAFKVAQAVITEAGAG